MARIELGLHADYAPGWGVWESLRDLTQNALDGQDKGYPMSVRRSDSGGIVFENAGVDLPIEAFLIGFSTKRGDDSQRGEHGEGLKMAMLGLVRSGVRVSVCSGGKSFTASIEESKNFPGVEVLVINTSKSKAHGCIRVLVGRGDAVVSESDWLQYRSKFLCFNPPASVAETAFGNVLLDEDRKGKLYVGGIYVREMPDLKYGFDLKHLKLNRDRDVPDPWETRWELSKVISAAFQKEAIATDDMLDMVQEGAEELKSAEYFMPASARDAIGAAFKVRHGEHAVAVLTDDQVNEVEASGRKAVKVHRDAFTVLNGRVANFETFTAEMRVAVTKVFAPSELEACQNEAIQDLQRIFGKYGAVCFAETSGGHVVVLDDVESGGADIYVPPALFPWKPGAIASRQFVMNQLIGLVADKVIASGSSADLVIAHVLNKMITTETDVDNALLALMED